MQLSNILVSAQLHQNAGLCEKFSGGYSEGGPPVPIPNTVVKSFSADDTSGATPWESRSLPGILSQGRSSTCPFPFVVTRLNVNLSQQRSNFSFIKSVKTANPTRNLYATSNTMPKFGYFFLISFFSTVIISES